MLKYGSLLFIFIFCLSCKGQTGENMKKHKHTNDLINETSPYLLQHAHNPVNWKPWNKKTLELAQKENKLVLISIGYAACHWCHVMEKECFEDEEVAKLMNKHFINIKIDREELPNVDQVYMTAVQLLTGRGGWPLNCVALPNGKPVWGGTYFPKDSWMEALQKLADFYKEKPEEFKKYAQRITEGVKSQNIVHLNTEKPIFTKQLLDEAIGNWKNKMDKDLGGRKGSPKFPMPNNYEFLLRYAYQNNDKEIINHVNTSLTKMAYGGIYDQVGGGFSRYSTDKKWHIPHFEKMLYDNAQLVSLYAKAYKITKNKLYKKVVFETLEFVKRELTNKQGVFYTSLDADSLNEKEELVEGAYYTFTKKELRTLLEDEFTLFQAYFNINDYGFWEDQHYVLIRNQENKMFAKKHHISEEELEKKISRWQNILFKYREKRKSPRLDDKTLTSWNALMIKGYIDAYKTFNEPSFLQSALKNATFIKEVQLQKEGYLFHNYKKGKSTINGFLEDYATVIDTFIALYEVTFDEQWLQLSKKLINYAIANFYNKKSGMFYFTHKDDHLLISRKTETEDNVMPSSNSIMAKNLFRLGHYFYDKEYLKMSQQMLNNVKKEMIMYGSGYSNWLQLLCNYTADFYEIAIVGKTAKEKLEKINQKYLPNKIVAGSMGKSNLPILKDRFSKGETLIYVCVDGACKTPTNNVKTALKQVNYKLK